MPTVGNVFATGSHKGYDGVQRDSVQWYMQLAVRPAPAGAQMRLVISWKIVTLTVRKFYGKLTGKVFLWQFQNACRADCQYRLSAPRFYHIQPDLVIAQCKAGEVGSFPALNARPAEELDKRLTRIKAELAEHDAANPDRPSAPFAVNQIVHGSNDRLMHDVEMCVKHEVPVVITSLGARPEVFDAIHSYGGICLQTSSTTIRQKGIEKGADGLICVAAGAGGHAGTLSPMAFIQEVREWFDGPILLSGAIGTG